MGRIFSRELTAIVHKLYNHTACVGQSFLEVHSTKMPVTEILLLRHGHRIAWQLDPTTGKYTSNHPFPTKLPADPPLASHGVDQAEETGAYLGEELSHLVEQDRLRIYSSLFYRCSQTLKPTVEILRNKFGSDLQVRGERGFGEWFGKAWFEQPSPADAKRLKTEFFPFIDDSYESKLIPDRHGERILELHNRVARAFSLVIEDVEQEYAAQSRDSEEVTLLICGHAAQIIASGRVLTGVMPDDLDEEDFKCFTCGISKFTRRRSSETAKSNSNGLDWQGKGVSGGWDCIWNSWCGHLKNGEERGWHFHGDESFDSYGAAAARGPILDSGSDGSREGPAKL